MNMRLNATNDRRMTLGYLTYQADVELTMPATEDCYHVNLTIAGETRASRSDGGREQTFAHRRGVVLSPVQTNMVRGPRDAEQMILKIPRTSLEAHLSDLLGKPVTQVVTFDFGLDLDVRARPYPLALGPIPRVRTRQSRRVGLPSIGPRTIGGLRHDVPVARGATPIQRCAQWKRERTAGWAGSRR